jgi:ATP-GRASP peptide maturase of grasp-with-spasm system
MIYILSNLTDNVTNKVCEWLVKWNKPFIRINSDWPTQALSITISEKEQVAKFINDGRIVTIQKPVSIWFRNGGLFYYEKNNIKEKSPSENFENYFFAEFNKISEYFAETLFDDTTIGNYFFREVNKLIVLKKALACGLSIPDTIVTGKKKIVQDFVSKQSSIICKPLTSTQFFYTENYTYSTYTRTMSIDAINLLEEEFIPALFQKKIDAFCEIRVFFLENYFYSMAIFLMADCLSSNVTDWRYAQDSKNKFTPFLLPEKIKKKLRNLSKGLQLNTGSFDLILGNDRNYYFLEVNPVGQFDFLNEHCNYHIEKALANKIVTNHEANKNIVPSTTYIRKQERNGNRQSNRKNH